MEEFATCRYIETATKCAAHSTSQGRQDRDDASEVVALHSIRENAVEDLTDDVGQVELGKLRGLGGDHLNGQIVGPDVLARTLHRADDGRTFMPLA